MMLLAEYQTRRKPLWDIKKSDATTANLGLWLERYIETTKKPIKGDRQEAMVNGTKARLVAEAHDLSLTQAKLEGYTVFYDRYRTALEAAGAQVYEASTIARMIVGLGEESLLENSITMHSAYGVPFIPGSALKGLCSSYTHQLGGEWRKNAATADNKPDPDAAHRTLFGDTDSAGFVTFYDALPLPTTWSLEREVMTVHHQDYYSGKEAGGDTLPPADWDSPNPVPFISASGSFLIAFSAPEGWAETVFELLERALERNGVGAKTSSGYGRMKLVDPSREAKRDLERAQTKERESQANLLENFKLQFDAIKRDQLSGTISGLVEKLDGLDPGLDRQPLAAHMLERARREGISKGKEEKAWFRTLTRLAGEA